MSSVAVGQLHTLLPKCTPSHISVEPMLDVIGDVEELAPIWSKGRLTYSEYIVNGSSHVYMANCTKHVIHMWYFIRITCVEHV